MEARPTSVVFRRCTGTAENERGRRRGDDIRRPADRYPGCGNKIPQTVAKNAESCHDHSDIRFFES